MYNRKTNGVETYIDDAMKKHNGVETMDESVYAVKNGVWTEVWPTKQSITPTVASAFGSYYHIYLKTISADTLEAYIGEYTPASQSSGYAELMSTLSFSGLRTSKNLTFDCNIQISGSYEYKILVDNVVWWIGSTSISEKKSISFSNNNLALGLDIKTRDGGPPTYAAYIKATISNVRNGGQKFIWAYPQTIYETWPQ